MKTAITTLSAVVSIAAGMAMASQQQIGEYPLLDGGFEDQAIGPPVIVSSTAGEQTQWTAQNALLGATNIAAGGRSGPRYMEINHSGATHHRLQSPTTTGILTGMPYVIQFYYQTLSSFIQGAIRAAVSPSGTQAVGFYTPYMYTNNVTEWTKFAAIYSTVTNAGSGNGLAVISINSNVQFLIDDVVVYAGTEVDTVAPDPPTVFTSNNVTGMSADLAWTAPGSGVDGGGYLVVRGTVDPTTAPNVNGIYAVGNSLGAAGTVVYCGANTGFSDSNLATYTTYRYRIYTVDKAFNYSTPLLGSVQTVPEPLAGFFLVGLAAFAMRPRA